MKMRENDAGSNQGRIVLCLRRTGIKFTEIKVQDTNTDHLGCVE